MENHGSSEVAVKPVVITRDKEPSMVGGEEHRLHFRSSSGNFKDGENLRESYPRAKCWN